MGMVEAPPAKVFELLREIGRWKEWDDSLGDIRTIDQIDAENAILYMKYKRIFNVYDTRDMVCFATCGKFFSEEDGKKAFAIYFKSVDHKAFPERSYGNQK